MYGNRLKELRKANNLSQGDVAVELDVSRQAISNWENDRSEPDLRNLSILCKLYGVTIDDLVREKEDEGKGKRQDKPKEDERKETSSVLDNELAPFFIIITLVLSAIIPIAGLIVSIFFLVLARKIQKPYWRRLIYVLCVGVLILSSYNCGQILSFHLETGYGTVEYIG